MVSTIPVTNTIPLNCSNEDSKERILFTLQVAVKHIQHCSSLESEGAGLTLQLKEVKQLCETLDKALFHGLKSFDKGYWPFVKQFTHRSTVDFLQTLDNAHTDVQRGRAWLTLALNEASLESYFRSFSQNLQVVKKHYKSLALLCDEQRMQLVLMFMAGLEYVPINIDTEKLSFGNGLSFFKGSRSQASSIIENPECRMSVPKSNWILKSDLDVVPCDNAAEVTCDFTISDKKSSPSEQRPSNFSSALAMSCSSDTNSSTRSPLTDELEMVSRYINIDAESDSKSTDDIEVVRAKVVRRTKRSSSQKENSCPQTPTDPKTQSDDSNSSLENRLSKATTDSGLCLETPCSTDSESNDFAGEDYDSSRHIAFDVKNFQTDICVTFSTPTRKALVAKSNDVQPEKVQEHPFESDSQSGQSAAADDGNISNDSNEDLEEEEISIYDMYKAGDSLLSQSSQVVAETTQTTPVNEDENPANPEISHDDKKTTDSILEEMAKLEQPEVFDIKVGNNILLYFLVEVFEHEEECFYKLFCAYSSFPEGQSQRIYILITNKSIYLLKPGDNTQKFYKCGSIRYSSIGHTLVDLNYQSFKIVSTEKMYYPVYTANGDLTRSILSHIEVGIRRFVPKLPLPSVYMDATVQVALLSKFLAKQLSCDRSKVVLSHYVLARWEDNSLSNVTSSGPVYQDYLMYRHKFVKENKATPWKPAYFLLKDGTLFGMEDENSKPFFYIQLCAPHCAGCRKLPHLNRPHAFEILRSNSDSLQLAASDTYEAYKWCQSILETVTNAGHFIDTEKNVQKPCCTVIANGKIIISIEEPRKRNFKLLGKANICDLATVFIDPASPKFLMFEFEIAEACKSSGEWIFYFESINEKEKFLNAVDQHWQETFQVKLNVENIKDLYILKRYRQVAKDLKTEKLSLEEFCADN